jgi:hypothetical protein
MFLALTLGGGALALIASLVFNFSIYALPFFVGLTTAKLAHDTGAGLMGAGLVGLVAAGLSFGLGQFALNAARSPIARLAVVTVFAAPAAVAGYFSSYGAAQLCTPAEIWRQVFAVVGGGIIATIAIRRLAASVPLRTNGSARTA